jgi:hypothetical protein
MARSLVEWAGQSGLELACRVYQTTEEENEHNRCNQRIQELAQHLELWPDPGLFEEDQYLTTIKFFATDGFFKAEPDSAPESDLRDRGKGAGGIVFISIQPNATVHGVRISSDKPEPGMNAFTWELATQLIALHMVKF